MSFVESVFSAGFIQKIVKVDLNVKVNHAYLSRKQLQKVPRSHATEAGTEQLLSGIGQSYLQAGRSPGPTCQPPLQHRFLHRLLDCIYTVYSSQFDPRAQD